MLCDSVCSERIQDVLFLKLLLFQNGLQYYQNSTKKVLKNKGPLFVGSDCAGMARFSYVCLSE